MNTKSSNYQQHSQHLKASLFFEDAGIEFLGLSKTKKVLWRQNKKVSDFEKLDNQSFAALSNAFSSNKEAREHLNILVENGKFISYPRKVELYTYFIYGGLECVSINQLFPIFLNSSPLLERDITLLDLMVNNKFKPEPITGALTSLATQTF